MRVRARLTVPLPAPSQWHSRTLPPPPQRETGCTSDETTGTQRARTTRSCVSIMLDRERSTQ